jgi:large subunit ribosomal protein L5
LIFGRDVLALGCYRFQFSRHKDLVNVALPRIRDFRGVAAKGFDGRGSYTLGLKEQTIFPEIDPNHSGAVQGMNITIVTTAKTDGEARELLSLLGMPFAS